VLGLEPDAFTGTLRIVDPHLPAWLPWLEIQGLRLGEAKVDLRWERSKAHTGVVVE
jgi:hypothetical protein